MINVTFGAAGSDFNESSFGFQAFVGANFKVEFKSGATEVDLDAARFYSNKTDYVELKGQFDLDEPEGEETATLLDNVVTLSSYKVVDNGKVAFQVSGLDVGAEDLESFKALSKYLSKSDYQITGNSAANEIYSGKGNDVLLGMDGNDFLFSGEGEDQLSGGKGNDTFDAGVGDDLINDKIGADTLAFHKGDGLDTVTGFNLQGRGSDTIDLSDYFSGDRELAYKELDISRSGKSDVLIELRDGDEILLKGVNIKDIDARDFDF